MRITGGQFRGRTVAVPKGRDIRPTGDKNRQAIFNMLMQYGYPDGAQVLDLFCGTGVLGLEALSRGAEYCTFVDNNHDSLRCAKANAATLKIEAQTKFIQKDAARLPAKALNFIPATLVFLDPPYRHALALPALRAAAEGGWLAGGAVCVIEAEKEAEVYVPDVFPLLKRKVYGETQIVICTYGPLAPRV